jgi:hypothetical protein
MIFVNLPVTDLARARGFYEGLGFTINPMFSDETTACVVVSETIYFMVMNHEKFAGFSPRPLADPATSTAVLTALTCDGRAEVDDLAARALAHGGADNGKTQDMGFMYSRSLSDPDGNVIELVWMDPAAVPPG